MRGEPFQFSEFGGTRDIFRRKSNLSLSCSPIAFDRFLTFQIIKIISTYEIVFNILLFICSSSSKYIISISIKMENSPPKNREKENLQTDNTMVDYKEKYERTEKEKQALHNSLEKTKKEMEAARRKLKEDDKKIEELEKGLSAKSDTIESLKTKHKEEVEELKKKLLQYQMMIGKVIKDLETEDEDWNS